MGEQMSRQEEQIVRSVRDLAGFIHGDDETASEEELMRRIDRGIYKGTDCGAWVAQRPNGIAIGSIVEGADYDAETKELQFPFTMAQFWDACQAVEDSADEIWKATHGCQTCAERQGLAWEVGEIPIDPECPDCKGQGVVI